MNVPEPLVIAAVLGAAGLLGGNSAQLIRLHQKLSDHIKSEEDDRKTLGQIRTRLSRVERKLPNGEVALMYKMVKHMYEQFNEGSLGKLQGEADEVDEACKKEQMLRAEELESDLFGDINK
jgi:hypothetical protein